MEKVFDQSFVNSTMDKAMQEVREKHPEVKGYQWEERVREVLAKGYNNGRAPESYDAKLYAEIIFDQYYND